MPSSPEPLPPPPMDLKVNPAFYRWLQTLYKAFGGGGGLAPGFIDQSQIQLANLGEKSHQSLTDILGTTADTDTTADKHVSDNQITTMNNATSQAYGTAQQAQSAAAAAQITANSAQSAANAAQGTANTNTGSINTINGQISTINNQIVQLAARSQVFNAAGAPSPGLYNDGDWYADTLNRHIHVKVSGAWVMII